ncbi:hypothetical protein KIN20_034283 [Parelaphostrongylus tenuis]|uniref:Uncharacterized protein n=1 Tax=Parelaphostrongylus tenuis TaxID=148309 RepID=A0AAD5QN65_PARTN|nr:hypothetical protein KIN20_012472 [Parelaphostrongylus tenuis]KAJ1372192.1 hypothetical protein KIN20_034283 [Parelaphostrongylus tenuis]
MRKMDIFITIARHLADLYTISLLATISSVFGCGVVPAGQMSTRNFTVTGFTLPVVMVYSPAADAPARVPGIATSEAAAAQLVQRLVMQTVLEVLESQARSALLPDAVISAILGQLSVTVTYSPLMCPKVHVGTMDMTTMLDVMEKGCIIVSNTVTGICTNMAAGGQKKTCVLPAADDVPVTSVPEGPLTIRGSLSTTNIILASWSRTMWQSVVNRAVRLLASGPFESHFFSATAAVGGN